MGDLDYRLWNIAEVFAQRHKKNGKSTGVEIKIHKDKIVIQKDKSQMKVVLVFE